MKRYKLGIVLFAEESRDSLVTLQSLLASYAMFRKDVQILLAAVGENQIKDELLNMAHNCGVEVCNLQASPNPVLDAVQSLDASYIHFTQGGVQYTEELACALLKSLSGNEERVILTKITGKSGRCIGEHNAFIEPDADSDMRSLYYKLIHLAHYATYVRTDLLRTDLLKEKTQIIWYAELRKLLFFSLSGFYNPCCLKESVYSQVTVEPIDLNLMNGAENPESYMSEFLFEMIDFYTQEYKADPGANLKKVLYNIFYYISRFRARMNESSDENEGNESVVDVEELNQPIRERIDAFFRSLKQVDAGFVFHNPYFNRDIIYFLLKRYKWKPIAESQKEDYDALMGRDYVITNILFLKGRKDELTIEGNMKMTGTEPFTANLVINGRKHACRMLDEEKYVYWFGERIYKIQRFEIQIPIEPQKTYKILISSDRNGVEYAVYHIGFGKYVPIVKETNSYWARRGRINRYIDEEHCLVISPETAGYRFRLRVEKAIRFLMRDKAARKAVLAHQLCMFLRKIKTRQIWLISDRVSRGDDNGECFFRYLTEHPIPGVIPYFVIDKSCPDYKRMKKVGRVIPVFSWKHKVFHLMSDLVISSQCNNAVINPFGRKIEKYYRNMMYDKKIVFLQHGVTKDDQSAWLNRFNRNLFGFVCSTNAEYQSVLEGTYYYTDKETWLTGMPRFDLLYHDEKKYVTLMPTWRKTLSDGTNEKGEWLLGTEFTESRYFHFYNRLLNDERLLSGLEKMGYTLCFMPHPNIITGLEYFDHDARVQFWDVNKSYREVFAETDLMITDYSSVAFDFAYLRKPIIYSQFDRAEFFAGGHSYKEGYFSYDDDGFGEVIENYEELVDRILAYVENGCQLTERYRERINRTFAFDDKENCRRVLEKILEHTGR